VNAFRPRYALLGRPVTRFVLRRPAPRARGDRRRTRARRGAVHRGRRTSRRYRPPRRPRQLRARARVEPARSAALASRQPQGGWARPQPARDHPFAGPDRRHAGNGAGPATRRLRTRSPPHRHSRPALPAAAAETGTRRVGQRLRRLSAADAAQRRSASMLVPAVVLDHAAIAPRIPHQGRLCPPDAVSDRP